jgi:uncharacterized protein (TIGR02270 family)
MPATLPPPARAPRPPTPAARVVPVVLAQHAEEAAMLRHVRTQLVRGPHAGLLQLGRLDERIAAHLDGLQVAGEAGLALCKAALERPGAGEVFALAWLSLALRDRGAWQQVLALAPALPEAWKGLSSALGWVSATHLQGVVRELLVSPDKAHQALGITACRLHRVDPGAVLPTALVDPDAVLRAAALRSAGELGRVDLLEPVRRAIADDHPDVVFWAARSACLLGERKASAAVLSVAATAAQSSEDSVNLAMVPLLVAAPAEEAQAWVRQLFSATPSAAGQPGDPRLQTRRHIRQQLRAVGLLGDARLVPWLIERMGDPPLARLAGEAFCWITGADLAAMDLETLDPPPDPERDAREADEANPDSDAGIELDADRDLPWPDPAKVAAWWQSTSATPTFQAGLAGQTRLFAGEPPSLAQAHRVLRDGTQRLRAIAAVWERVLAPGQPLFAIAAPARRQQRWLREKG